MNKILIAIAVVSLVLHLLLRQHGGEFRYPGLLLGLVAVSLVSVIWLLIRLWTKRGRTSHTSKSILLFGPLSN
jgi:hypothetical protein